jgi:NitT/TauT family transport system permease protein
VSQTHDPDVLEAFEGDIPAEQQIEIGRWATRLREVAPAIAIFFGALLAWELIVAGFGIEEFLLPRPSVIVRTLGVEWSEILKASFATFQEALGGFAIGATLGVTLALATARWTGFREGAMPFSKMAVVAVIVFFPVMINTTRGLVEVDPGEIELLRSYAATPRQLVVKIRIPNALPFLFSALKVATVLAVIGAIVAEYFGGPRQRLGVYITQQASLLHTAEAWAAIFVATVLGVGFYVLILVAERVAMPWHSAYRAGIR